jgi:putative MFS transporter
LVPVFAWFSLGNAYEGEDEQGSWQLFCILCAIPCIISTILGILLVPESPRWLLTKGRNEEALAILRMAAEGNGLNSMVVFPPGTYLISNEDLEEGGLMELFSPKWLRTTLLLWVAWFGLAFLYYGAILAISIMFTDVEQEGADGAYSFDYQAIFISASSEFVGLFMVLATIDRWGRIPTQTFTYLLGGVSCLFMGYASHFGASRSVLIALAFVARMAMMGATCTTWVSTSEILTTDIRATGHGWANAMARIGGFFCPYVISERNSMNHIGLFLFTVSCIAAAVVWQLPETSGHKLGSEGMTTTTTTKGAVISDDDDGGPKEGRDYARFEE